MVRALLIRGMLVGLVAGLIGFGFAYLLGEPAVDHAILLEEQASAAATAAGDAAATEGTAAHSHDAAEAAAPQGHSHGGEGAEVELVSRPIQGTVGLLVGVVVYSVALGGLFALAFAFVYGRVGRAGPRATAALLAGTGFVVVSLVPSLIYPANPPAVGQGETIGYRTGLYFLMIAISLAAAAGATVAGQRASARLGQWNGALVGAAAFLVVIVVARLILPTINEVQDGFPADLLWQFRLVSLGLQLVLWAGIGLMFGPQAERVLLGGRRMAKPAARSALGGA